MTDEDRKILLAAFKAGFNCSGEGFNGEWDFFDDEAELEKVLEADFEAWQFGARRVWMEFKSLDQAKANLEYLRPSDRPQIMTGLAWSEASGDHVWEKAPFVIVIGG